MSAGRAVVADVRGMNRAQAVLVSRRCALLAVCLPTRREVGLSRKTGKSGYKAAYLECFILRTGKTLY